MNSRTEKAGSEKPRGTRKRYIVEKTAQGAVVKPESTGAQMDGAAAATAESAEQHRAMIAQAAYYRAERRGFEPGRELDDWLEAEAEITASRLAQV